MSTVDRARDDELVAAIAGGDRAAFAALYRRRRSDVYRFALHISGSTAVADDVTQDVFVAVIHDAARYVRGRSGVVPWLLGIARNHVRRRAARERSLVPLSDEAACGAGQLVVEAAAEGELARKRGLIALRQALLTLPVPYREAVVLCDLQELSYADAAVTLGCAIGTVRSRLHRGRAMLGRRLRGDEPAFIPAPQTRYVV